MKENERKQRTAIELYGIARQNLYTDTHGDKYSIGWLTGRSRNAENYSDSMTPNKGNM